MFAVTARFCCLLASVLSLGWSLGAHAADAVPAKRPPNILFAIADDWGCHAGAYGIDWVATPNVDRVAREGVRFTRAYTPNAKCAPSRACILTGRNSWQLKEAANHICYFPPEFKGFCEALRDSGWFVGHTTKGWGPGVAKDAAGNPREMTGKAYNRRKAAAPTPDILATDYAANFADFLEETRSDQPWLFWYGAVEPHRGYQFGSGRQLGGKSLSDIDHVPGYWPDNETVRNDLLDYAFEVEHFDRHLGRMLETLEAKGLLDQTLVIVTSDHGFPFPRGKGSAYADSNHIPLLARGPSLIKEPGRAIDDYVSFVDLAPTFIEVAEIDWKETGMAPTVGRSLVPLFASSKSGQIDPSRDRALVGMERHDIGRPGDVGYPIRGIHHGNWLYLRNFEPDRWPACNPETGYLNVDASPTKSLILANHRQDADDPAWRSCFGKRPLEELYDLTSDPDCLTNLADDPQAAERKAELWKRLQADLVAQEDPRILGKGEVFDQYLHANAKHVGFYEKFMRGELETPGWVAPTDFDKP